MTDLLTLSDATAPVAIFLCDKTGIAAEPWAAAGVECYCVDVQHSIRRDRREGNINFVWGDVRSWMPPTEIRGRIVFGAAFPPCFTGDTLVLTERGYKPISEILIGERVLTHRQRWKSVTNLHIRYAEATTILKVTGSPEIVTTAEHPFYAKRRSWHRTRRQGISVATRVETEAEWVAAASLQKGHLVGSVLPPVEPCEVSDMDLWLMGRYVADGHVRIRRGQVEAVIFSIGKRKAQAFRDRCSHKYGESEERTATRFHMYGREFCEQFLQFGKRAPEKTLPGWVLTLPVEQARVFLDGYLSGDGYFSPGRISASSVSRRLATSVALLMRRVFGRSSSINRTHRRPQNVIEGRTVNQMDSWEAYCTPPGAGRSIASIDGDWTWNAFRDAKVGGAAVVYNLSVEEDESYTVDQCVVHNCTDVTVAGARDFLKKGLHRLTDALELFAACERAFAWAGCPYFIENPVGVISTHYRRADYSFQPWQYNDLWSKQTCIWAGNGFVMPEPLHREKPEGVTEKIWLMPPSAERANLRSETPRGFAEAVFRANAPLLKLRAA